jgi:hypothetical protein
MGVRAVGRLGIALLLFAVHWKEMPEQYRLGRRRESIPQGRKYWARRTGISPAGDNLWVIKARSLNNE